MRRPRAHAGACIPRPRPTPRGVGVDGTCRRALGLDGADFRYFRALQLQFNGRIGEAEAETECCLAMGPTFGRASLTLARLRRQTAAGDHVESIRSRFATVDEEAKTTPPSSSPCTRNSTPWANTGRHGPPCCAETESCRAGSAMTGRRTRDLRCADRQVRCGDPCGKKHHRRSRPIFIVGMPRSGTTLLERILGNHSMVMPPANLRFPRQLRWAADSRPCAVDLPLLEASHWIHATRSSLPGTDPVARARPALLRGQAAAQFHAARFHPSCLAACQDHPHGSRPDGRLFSNYRALFGDSYGYSYDLESLGHHHGQYRRLMRHWHRSLPGFVLDIDYDELVRDTESAARRLLGFCGLPYEPACLDTTRNHAPVATLSSAQVRAPSTSARGEWRRYEHQLQPLRGCLAPADAKKQEPGGGKQSSRPSVRAGRLNRCRNRPGCPASRHARIRCTRIRCRTEARTLRAVVAAIVGWPGIEHVVDDHADALFSVRS